MATGEEILQLFFFFIILDIPAEHQWTKYINCVTFETICDAAAWGGSFSQKIESA